MKYLADTVTIIRHFAKHGKIGKKAKVILDGAEKGRHLILISVISLVEIMYLSERMRIKINLAETLEMINKSANYSIVDLNQEIVMLADKVKRPEFFDRLILSTAKFLEVPLITPDGEIHEIDIVKTIW